MCFTQIFPCRIRYTSIYTTAILVFLILTGSLFYTSFAQSPNSYEPFAVWSPDGSSLAVANGPQALIHHTSIPQPVNLSAAGNISALTFSESGTLIGTWDDSQSATVWNATTGEVVAQRTFQEGRGSVNVMQFIEDDSVLAFNYFDLTVYMFGKRHLPFKAQDQPIVPGMYRAGIYRWHFETNEILPFIGPFAAYPSGESDLVFSHDETLVATVRKWDTTRANLSINIRDTSTGAIIYTLQRGELSLLNLAFNPIFPHQLVSLSATGRVHIQYITEPEDGFSLTLLRGRIQSFALKPDGQELATGGIDGKVRLWNLRTGEMLDVYEGQPADVTQLTYTESGELLAFGDPLFYPRVWNPLTLETISDFRIALTPTPAPTQTPSATFSVEDLLAPPTFPPG